MADKQQFQVIDVQQFDGLNTLDDATVIAPSESPYMVNMDITSNGSAQTRFGYEKACEISGTGGMKGLLQYYRTYDDNNAVDQSQDYPSHGYGSTYAIPTSISELAANYLTAGKTIRIKMSGTLSGVGSTGAFGFKLGSTTLMSFSSVGGVNGYNFQLEAVMTCMTTGASGTAIGSIKLIAYNSSSSVGWSGFANGSTINTTISNALDIITTMPSNLTATIYDVTIEALN